MDILELLRSVALERREEVNQLKIVDSPGYKRVHEQHDRIIQWLEHHLSPRDRDIFRKLWQQLEEAQSDLDSLREEVHYLQGIGDGISLAHMLTVPTCISDHVINQINGSRTIGDQ